MKPVHIITERENVSELVLMPGDPLRAKYIAENFLTDAYLINDVRNMLGFTGYYKGVKVTVMASGMGIPSMGIYSYELIKFYGVKKIIRIGSAGSLDSNVKIRDLVVANEASSFSTFAYSFSKDKSQIKHASKKMLDDFKECSKEYDNVHFGPIITSDTFDVYSGADHIIDALPVRNPLAIEMEAFGLFHIAEVTGIDAACILTVVDSKFEPDVIVSSEERETSLNDMINLSLEVLIKK